MKRPLALTVSLGLVAFGLAIIFGGCSESPTPTFDNPLDERNGQGLPIPDSLVVTVGNNAVRVCWGLPENETADEFAVFRQRIDVVEGEKQVATTNERCYLDTGVRNGRAYAYRIKACREGRCGPISENIEARPNVFSMLINDDAPKTRNRTVTVGLSAPGAQSVRLAMDADSLTIARWRPVAAALSYTFPPGDGTKTLFAEFLLLDGSESLPLSDTIVLDTQARITSVDFDGAQTRYAGEILHFRLAAGEPGGTASVTVAGLVTALPLFDDGSSGDPVAGNGVYERDWTISAGITVTSATVTGQFTDDIGNVAASMTGPRTLTVLQTLDPVTLIEPATLAVPPDPAAVTLRWTQSTATDAEFSGYQIFRSESETVDSTSSRVGTVTPRTNLEFTDSDVVEFHKYSYRVYVLVRSGQQRGSNAISVVVDNERIPTAVNLQAASSVAATSLTLRWSVSGNRDFKAYMVCRNTTGTVTLGDSLPPPIFAVDRNSLQEQGLEPSTTYHYAVFVQDEGELWSQPSNEIKVTTEPDGVTLVSATPVAPPDPAAVTLRWTQATATDFSLYQVFRAESEPVDLTSELVGTVTARSTLQFTDSTVVEGRTYCYGLYVLTTTGRQTRSTNTLCVAVPNVRTPEEVTLDPASGVGATSLSLRWSRSADRDFRAYFVCRDTTPTVALGDSVARISDSNENYRDEFGLVPSTTYYYRVFVEDTAGRRSPSNEISATTAIAAGATSVLLQATDVSGTGATLEWEASRDPLFALYRLYRDEISAVTTASTLVMETGERDATSFRDTVIRPDGTYYYRVYIVAKDDAVPKASNTIQVTTSR